MALVLWNVQVHFDCAGSHKVWVALLLVCGILLVNSCAKWLLWRSKCISPAQAGTKCGSRSWSAEFYLSCTRTKWLLWNVQVHFACAGSHRECGPRSWSAAFYLSILAHSGFCVGPGLGIILNIIIFLLLDLIIRNIIILHLIFRNINPHHPFHHPHQHYNPQHHYNHPPPSQHDHPPPHHHPLHLPHYHPHPFPPQHHPQPLHPQHHPPAPSHPRQHHPQHHRPQHYNPHHHHHHDHHHHHPITITITISTIISIIIITITIIIIIDIIIRYPPTPPHWLGSLAGIFSWVRESDCLFFRPFQHIKTVGGWPGHATSIPLLTLTRVEDVNRFDIAIMIMSAPP